MKFEYKRNEIPDTVDSSYREEIFVELDYNNLEFVTTNFKVQKILFARWCYCKGQTGYYKIHQGELLIKRIQNETYELNLKLKTDKVPQIINQISQVFSLE